ncbi:type I restriction enzyme HsdR N-terminal domain-containing protein [Rhizobium sp. BT03]|uniref:NACHT domain-containing protein n=1 Tax=Rhizobium sp. BT03 TaxID=3045156 RepID=UPI0024B3D757|nr:type I restriction enzyme HsdR N-terminal domain-containing protein [Rhizobium sp. BT03]WHO74876.1 type I restriction enzyme HsdR N-terminal domain-containing protein [Rhizobium sp. BT03]
MDDFWTREHSDFESEADVETRFVTPLLLALGHALDNIAAKKRVLFREGRNSRIGRKPEADFVVYADRPHCRATALLVVETKHPREMLDQGREQAESYAQNIRTPLYLLTNGKQVEVWQLQIVGDSELVFSDSVENLAASRGHLEGLASRDALLSLCTGLRFKNMDVVRRDLSEYETNETRRCERELSFTVPRFLTRAGQDDVQAELVLDGNEKGAIVLGSSGFGKTTLGKALLLEALEKRLEGSSAQLPFEVFLPDVPVGECTLETYLVGRVSAHVPGYNLSAFKDEAKTNGVLIVADAFDRVSSLERPKLTTQLRNILRDFPKSRILVLSRPNLLPDIALSTFSLRGFDEKDMWALLVNGRELRDRGYSRFKLPEHLVQLCQIPLLASLVANHYHSFERFPTNVNTLYEEWLGRILHPFPVVEKAQLRAFLEELSAQTAIGPMDIGRCFQLAKEMDVSAGLNQLADADAITIRGTSVELVHEGLADFFRAQRLLRLPPAELLASLNAISTDGSSQFPGLLLSGAPTPEASRVVWEALAGQSIKVALASLKFTIGDGERRPVSNSRNVAEALLTDVLTSIEVLLRTHFSDQFAFDVRSRLAGRPVSALGIEGHIDRGFVNFSFFDAEQDDTRVRFGEAEEPYRSWGIALDKQDYDAGAGRILGAQRIADAIKELIDCRRLRGGPVWTQETVLSRLRHLARFYSMKFSAPYDLEHCKADLLPISNRRMGDRLRSRAQYIHTGELIEDIDGLMSDGITVLHEWWVEPRDLDFNAPVARAKLAHTLDEYFRRSQQAYVEVVRRDLPGLAAYLRECASIPVRYDLRGAIVKVHGGHDLHLNYERWPVRDLANAGADLSFPENPMIDLSRSTSDAYISKTELVLAKVGRPGSDFRITRGGIAVPQFNGRSHRSGDREDETAVVSYVAKMLSDDCQQVFSVIPAFRWR